MASNMTCSVLIFRDLPLNNDATLDRAVLSVIRIEAKSLGGNGGVHSSQGTRCLGSMGLHCLDGVFVQNIMWVNRDISC